MVRAEFKRLFHKKSFYVLSIILILIMVTWIFSVYYAGVEELKQGLPYEQTQLRCLEPQNIFRQVLLQVSLSIEIVPFIIMGAIIVYDDLKEKTLLQIAVINRNKWKYFMNKYLILLIYNLVILLIYFGIGISFSFMASYIDTTMWKELFSPYQLASFVMFWLGISFWGMAAMAVTCLTKSGIGGSCVGLYVLAERIYSSTTAVTFHNPVLMKINELLPWENFNTLFVYAGNLNDLLSGLTEAEKLIYASGLTMYQLISYNETIVPYPYFKGIMQIIGVCVIFMLLITGIYLYGYQRCIRKL